MLGVSDQPQEEAMSQRIVRTLVVLTAALAVGELVSAVIIWREAYPDAAPVAAALFAIPFVVATLLLISHRVVAGTVVAGLFSLFEAVQFPGWTRHSVLDAVYQSAYAALAIAVLMVSVAVLVTRRRAVAGQGHPGPSS
jgi:uncharacterized membrane protein